MQFHHVDCDNFIELKRKNNNSHNKSLKLGECQKINYWENKTGEKQSRNQDRHAHISIADQS